MPFAQHEAVDRELDQWEAEGEAEYGNRWRQLYEMEKHRLQEKQLDQEMKMEMEKLRDQMEFVRHQHETEMLRERLHRREKEQERARGDCRAGPRATPAHNGWRSSPFGGDRSGGRGDRCGGFGDRGGDRRSGDSDWRGGPRGGGDFVGNRACDSCDEEGHISRDCPRGGGGGGRRRAALTREAQTSAAAATGGKVNRRWLPGRAANAWRCRPSRTIVGAAAVVSEAASEATEEGTTTTVAEMIDVAATEVAVAEATIVAQLPPGSDTGP